MKNKTFCIFSALFLPHLGGVERYTYEIAKRLYQKGYHVIVVTSKLANMKQKEIVDGIEVYRLPSYSFLRDRLPIINRNKELIEMMNEIWKCQIDYAIINTRFYPLSLYAAKYCKKKNVPSIVIDHGSNHLKMGTALLDILCAGYEHLVTYAIKKSNTEFYGVSDASSKWLQHFGIRAKGTLYNCVDVLEIQQSVKEKNIDFRKEYGIEDAFIVSFVGRIVPEKGILILRDAIREIRKINKNIYLLVAGNGSLKQQLEKEDGVILLGQLAHSDTLCLLAQSDLMCLPSTSEGFPTSVLEAVACECFTAATRVGGAREIIPSDEYGIILSDNNTTQIIKAIEFVLENPEKASLATQKCLQRLEKNFTWEQTVAKLIRILEG